jgi:predicted transcriptional regulator
MISEIKIPDISNGVKKKDLLNILVNKYSMLGPMWENHQMEWMNGVYASFNNHDKFLIIIFLLKKTLDTYSRNFTKLTYDEFYKEETIEIAKFNVTEVSTALNIPKESARRKINELEYIGVIKRFKKKIIIDRSAFKYVKPINSIKRISRFLSVLSRICENEKILSRNISSEKIESTIKNNFSYLWKIYYDMQIPMLLTYKKLFVDLESFHIFGTCVVNQHLHNQQLNKIMIREDFIESLLSVNSQGLNAMSISDITGIPRATVIRKLQKLLISNNLTIDEKKLYNLSGQLVQTLEKPQYLVLNHLSHFSAIILNLAIM